MTDAKILKWVADHNAYVWLDSWTTVTIRYEIYDKAGKHNYAITHKLDDDLELVDVYKQCVEFICKKKKPPVGVTLTIKCIDGLEKVR